MRNHMGNNECRWKEVLEGCVRRSYCEARLRSIRIVRMRMRSVG